mgnify:CR=1 FL=1
MTTKIPLLAFALLALAAGTAQAQTELTVYTGFEADLLERYAAAFSKAHPDITIDWVRDSTGVVTAKLLAEKNNPQADVIWGIPASSLLLLKAEDMLEPYAPAGVETLDARFRDSAEPPSWVGMSASPTTSGHSGQGRPAVSVQFCEIQEPSIRMPSFASGSSEV